MGTVLYSPHFLSFVKITVLLKVMYAVKLVLCLLIRVIDIFSE